MKPMAQASVTVVRVHGVGIEEFGGNVGFGLVGTGDLDQIESSLVLSLVAKSS